AFKRDASDIAGRADLLSRAAKLYTGRLGNRRAAIDVWKLVLALDPNDTDTTAPAAAALEGLYTETGDIAGLVKILGMQVRWAPSGKDRKKILFRIAELQEKSLGDVDAAVATLRSVLEIDPQERAAIDALDRIFEAGAAQRSPRGIAAWRRPRSTGGGWRSCASGSTWPATRRRARSCGVRSRAC